VLFTLLLASAVLGAPGRPDAPAGPEASLEETVLRSCLLPAPAGYAASPQRQQRQQMPFPLTPPQRAQLLFPQHPELVGRTMGWVLPDREYTASIPLEAKVIPRDLSELPVLRFNNLEIQGERELRWRSHGEYDQWFLHDVTRKLHALMAIHRQTRRVYFFEYRWKAGRVVYDQSTESCYSCHASGPRVIRTYELAKVDRARQAEFNRKLLAYGAAQFGDSLDPDRLGPALADPRCTGCHDGTTRGRLYAMHLPTIAYYLQSLHAMPPRAPLAGADARELIEGQYQRFLAATRSSSQESPSCPGF
jgi:hypothetical protein